MNKIKAPKYIPAEVMRKLTRNQLQTIHTQKNTRGKYSQNAHRANQILYYSSGRTSLATGVSCPLSMQEKGWEIPTEETVDLRPWLNGTEVQFG